MKRFLLALSLAAVFCSCSRKVESNYDTIAYVDDLLSDSLSTLKGLVKLSGKPSGVIALTGDPKLCLQVSEKLMTSDEFDNIDGKKNPDGLPDFAGETIVSLLDFANSPYEGYLSTDEGMTFLRELTVRNAVSLLDTSCSINPYDKASRVSKGSPKLLLICSPVLADYGGDDVSDLFERIGCDVPVIYSKDTSFSFTEACYKLLRDRNLFTHDIAYPSGIGLLTVPATKLPEEAYSPSGEFNDGYKFSRVSGALEPSYSIISFSERYVPVSFSDSLSAIAPKTCDSYVQNKH